MEQKTGTGIDKLAPDYVKAWAALDVVVKNSDNPHFKSGYADLTAVLDTIRPVFAKYNLALFQAPGRMVELANGELAVSIVGVLMHSSGQSISIDTQLPLGGKATAQAAGSAITYAKRYQAQSVGGIAPVDDDGNAASVAAESAPPKKPSAAKPEPKAEPAKDKPKKEAAPVEEAPPGTPAGLLKAIKEAAKASPEVGLSALKLMKEAVRSLNDPQVAEAWMEARNGLKEKSA
jgi:hypothetical protein